MIKFLRAAIRHPKLSARRCMSVRPQISPSPPKTTIARLAELRATNTPIAVLTAYDFPSARACSAHPVDITLVGDSLAQVCLGYPSTTRLTLDEMLHHCRAVARGTTTPLLVADMPFGSCIPGPSDAVRAAVRLVQEGHVEAVKLEGGLEIIPHVTALTQFGIPVMGHVGLLPQRATSLSGYRVQGRTAASASSLVRAAQELERAGAFAIVLEAMPSLLGDYITRAVKIPTIGIGAGPGTSGQVLVWDDMLGTWHGHKAKFVRYFADVQKEIERGVASYVHAVKDGSFPNPEREGYAVDPAEWDSFIRLQGEQVHRAGEHTEERSSLGNETDAAPRREGRTEPPTARPAEFAKASGVPRANETDEKTGKRMEARTF